jgi:GNAT superfamily N-acetyltransferase
MSMTKNIIIRPFENNDAVDVSRLIIDNLMQVNIVDYGEAAVEQLALFHSPEWILRYAQSSETFVAEVRSEIIGTATLDQERVRSVFVRMDHHKQGIGRLMMHHIEEAANRQKLARLTLLANIGAVDFYRNLGYVRGEKKVIEVGDAQITVVAMEKTLLKP